MSPHFDQIVDSFQDLFEGRSDAQGTWDGGSVRAPVGFDLFAGHLTGKTCFGVYPLLDDSTVKWGCSDIDVDDLDAARNLQTAFFLKGVVSYVEKTRRGYHVWVFADDWVPAWIMRRAFLAAHQVVKLPAKEVNPKQEVSSGLGNYVRLPYPNGYNSLPSERMMLGADDGPLGLEEFLEHAFQHRTPMESLYPLAQMFQPPRRKAELPAVMPANLRESFEHINAYIANIWWHGPLPGSDRSNTLVRLAHLMREHGTPINHAFNLLVGADRRWGKFHGRADCVEQLTKIIEDCYGEESYTEEFSP